MEAPRCTLKGTGAHGYVLVPEALTAKAAEKLLPKLDKSRKWEPYPAWFAWHRRAHLDGDLVVLVQFHEKPEEGKHVKLTYLIHMEGNMPEGKATVHGETNMAWAMSTIQKSIDKPRVWWANLNDDLNKGNSKSDEFLWLKQAIYDTINCDTLRFTEKVGPSYFYGIQNSTDSLNGPTEKQ